VKTYAIGDIHGQAAALDEIHSKIDDDLKDHPVDRAHIVYLGDYIDRGDDSAGVVDRLIGFSEEDQGISRTFLKGNHENFLLGMVEKNMKTAAFWLKSRQGGRETIKSYGVDVPDDDVDRGDPRLVTLCEEFKAAVQARGHLEFYRNLELVKESGDYVFAHAGLRPGTNEQTEIRSGKDEKRKENSSLPNGGGVTTPKREPCPPCESAVSY